MEHDERDWKTTLKELCLLNLVKAVYWKTEDELFKQLSSAL